MNNYQYTQMQNTSVPKDVTPSLSPGEAFEIAAGISGILIVIGFIVFILWVWSLISTISLNSKFSRFMEEYRDDSGRDPYTGYVTSSEDEPLAVEAKEELHEDEASKKSQSHTRVIVLASIGGVLIVAALVVLLLVS